MNLEPIVRHLSALIEDLQGFYVTDPQVILRKLEGLREGLEAVAEIGEKFPERLRDVLSLPEDASCNLILATASCLTPPGGCSEREFRHMVHREAARLDYEDAVRRLEAEWRAER